MELNLNYLIIIITKFITKTNKLMKYALTNAFPATPMQDKFGQIVFPTAGLSKLEYYALELYKTYCLLNKDSLGTYEHIGPEKLMETAIFDATELITLLEEKTKDLQNEKDNTLAIIEP